MLEAVEAISEDPLALDHLADLEGLSLVSAERRSDGPRFRMLDTVREYAAERFPPTERGPLARGHAGYFLELADRAALAFSLAEEGSAELGLRLAGALGRFFTGRGRFLEARRRLAALKLLSLVHRALGNLRAAWSSGEEGLALAREAGDRRLVASSPTRSSGSPRSTWPRATSTRRARAARRPSRSPSASTTPRASPTRW